MQGLNHDYQIGGGWWVVMSQKKTTQTMRYLPEKCKPKVLSSSTAYTAEVKDTDTLQICLILRYIVDLDALISNLKKFLRTTSGS